MNDKIETLLDQLVAAHDDFSPRDHENRVRQLHEQIEAAWQADDIYAAQKDEFAAWLKRTEETLNG